MLYPVFPKVTSFKTITVVYHDQDIGIDTVKIIEAASPVCVLDVYLSTSFGVDVNGIILKILSLCSLILYRNRIDFCTFISCDLAELAFPC